MITGTAGNDYLTGISDGVETFIGGTGADVMFGGNGEDIFVGHNEDRANDFAFGEAGHDRYIWSPRSRSDYFDGGTGIDTVELKGLSTLQILQGLVGLQTDGGTVSFTSSGGMATISFVADGEPRPFTGTLVSGTNAFCFANIERITWRL
jgi:Ca2+-binding RTX toxin-like protein